MHAKRQGVEAFFETRICVRQQEFLAYNTTLPDLLAHLSEEDPFLKQCFETTSCKVLRTVITFLSI
jgi:hypothetical protein